MALVTTGLTGKGWIDSSEIGCSIRGSYPCPPPSGRIPACKRWSRFPMC
jgi:hypothetical protein